MVVLSNENVAAGIASVLKVHNDLDTDSDSKWELFRLVGLHLTSVDIWSYRPHNI